MDHFTGTPDHRASPLRQQQLIILLILSIHVPYAANRFNGTWSLLPIGQIGPLFHSRMIRTAGRGRGLVDSDWIDALSVLSISAQSFKKCNQVIRHLPAPETLH